MTWKARAPIFHDPSEAEFLPGQEVPHAVIKDSPWLVEAGLVVDPDAPASVVVAADAAAPEAEPAPADLDDPEAVTADEEG